MSRLEENKNAPRITLRPTGFGFAFLGVICALFLLGVHFSNNLAFTLCFFLIGLAISSAWLTYMNLAGLSLEPLGAKPAFAGQNIAFNIDVKSKAKRAHWALELSAKGTEEGIPFSLSGGEHEVQSLNIMAEKRGWFHLRSFKLSTRFPLGICEARRDFHVDENRGKCLIYPRLDGSPILPDAKHPDGVRRADQLGDFSDVREYERGDSLNSIAWKLSAKSSGLVTKTFEGGEGVPHLWLSWDMVQEKGLEPALSQLSQWVVSAKREGVAFGLSIPGRKVELDTGERQMNAALKLLALYQNETVQGAE